MEKLGTNWGWRSCSRNFHALSRYTTLTPQLLDVLTNPPNFEVFMEVLWYRNDWWNCWPLAINVISITSPLPRGGSGAKSSNPLNPAVVFLETSPILKTSRGPQIPIISLAKNTLTTPEIPMVLGAVCHKPGTETKYTFIIYSGFLLHLG